VSVPFAGSQHLYDAIYSWKDYPAEAERLRPLLRGDSILDVACGTGGHIPHLRGAFEVVGVDIDPAMVEIARRKNPGVELHVADMRAFDLGRTFGSVICLFSSIAYLQSVEDLEAALRCFARHAEPGGAVLVEPWVQKDSFQSRPPQLLSHQGDELTIARMGHVEVAGDFSLLHLHYLVGSKEGVQHLQEVHTLRLFTDAEYRGAFEAAGLTVEHDPEGPMGRGLYAGRRP
jgi:SAM-dependent methyltransferase